MTRIRFEITVATMPIFLDPGLELQTKKGHRHSKTIGWQQHSPAHGTIQNIQLGPLPLVQMGLFGQSQEALHVGNKPYYLKNIR